MTARLTFPAAIRAVLSQYATFTGRARRSEYWWFYLFSVLVSIGTGAVDATIAAVVGGNEVGVVGLVASLALFLPTLAVTARRLHDTNRTGWWMLAPVVPLLLIIPAGLLAFLGGADGDPGPVFGLALLVLGVAAIGLGIALFVFTLLDSTPGPNRYGPSPKYPHPPQQPGYYPPHPPQQPGYYPPHPPQQPGYYPPQQQ
jgi:uncharacterized membrane protein YhaH (DUF805 family)